MSQPDIINIMVNEKQVKSVLNKQKRQDDWFLTEYSVNPYMGCPFCIYCYARGSKYGAHRPKGLTVKINAPEVLDKQLFNRAKKGQYGFIGFASEEPYLPIEKEYKISRRLLEIILKHKFPVHVLTKSTLIVRDLDILRQIDKKAILPKNLISKLKHRVIISFSFSTIDEKTAKIFEPGAPKPKERLETMKKCKKAGFLVGACFIPVLPFISDSEEQLEYMIKSAKDYGADYVFVGSLTLFGDGPTDCKTMVFKALEKHFPELLPKYQKMFQYFFYPPQTYQGQLDETARRICKRYKIKYRIM